MWNSLEIAKLVVGICTPLLLLGLGVVINRAAKRIEHAQWTNQKVIERRLAVYDKMAPLLNDIFCFFRFRGDFRSFEPKDIVDKKREVDRDFHINKPLFGERFHRDYRVFMKVYFKEFDRAGEDAKLRTTPEAQEYERGSWDPGWTASLAPQEASTQGDLQAAYDRLMATFAAELGVLAGPSAPLERERGGRVARDVD